MQRPNIGETIAIDMLLLRRLMALVDKHVDALSQPLVPLVDEFAARLFGELDYIAEGRNCEKFTALYKDVPRVRTPGIKCVHGPDRPVRLARPDADACAGGRTLRARS